jgi:hypothetical protein
VVIQLVLVTLKITMGPSGTKARRQYGFLVHTPAYQNSRGQGS